MKIIPLFLVFCCALSARADEDRYRDLPQLGGPQGISGGKDINFFGALFSNIYPGQPVGL